MTFYKRRPYGSSNKQTQTKLDSNQSHKGLSCEINYKPTVEHDENDYTVHNIIVIGRKK